MGDIEGQNNMDGRVFETLFGHSLKSDIIPGRAGKHQASERVILSLYGRTQHLIPLYTAEQRLSGFFWGGSKKEEP